MNKFTGQGHYILDNDDPDTQGLDGAVPGRGNSLGEPAGETYQASRIFGEGDVAVNIIDNGANWQFSITLRSGGSFIAAGNGL